MSFHLQIVTIFIFSVCLIKWYWSRRKLFQIANQVSGPYPVPIVGNALEFCNNTDESFSKLRILMKKYEHPMRIWLGPRLILIFSDVHHVEKIMSSSKMAYKSDIYRFMKDILGNGLVAASGPQWKKDRRTLYPLFSLEFAYRNLDKTEKHFQILNSHLDKLIDCDYVDVHEIFHNCCFDLISDIIYGVNTETQKGKNVDLRNAFFEGYNNIYTQMIRPWIHSKIVFNLTNLSKRRLQLKHIIRNATRKAIRESYQRLEDIRRNNYMDPNAATPIVDLITQKLINEPNLFTEEEFIDHLAQLFVASEDTVTLTICNLVSCFGMYPEYQAKAVEEIKNVLGDESRKFTIENMIKLQYLEMCVKESARLVTIAPFILRKCTEEFSVGKYIIPPGCDVLIPIFEIHRDPHHWENPEHFHPDHFLPEAVKQRHPHAYLGFSSGPRSCIGKHLAIQIIKFIMANVLRIYMFEANGKFPDVKLKADISVRPIDGHIVKIRRRKW